MNNKLEIINMLREEYERWESLLTGLSEEQIINKPSPSELSVKDVIAHLQAWQQISIARMEAALDQRNPIFPEWLAGTDPFEAESDDNRDNTNNIIFQIYLHQPWSDMHHIWKAGFLHFLDLAERISENEMFETGKYKWLQEHPLSDVLLGSYEHHEEHLEGLQVRF